MIFNIYSIINHQKLHRLNFENKIKYVLTNFVKGMSSILKKT